MANKNNPSPKNSDKKTIDTVKNLDSAFNQLLKDNSQNLNAMDRGEEINSILNSYNDLIQNDAYSFNTNKSMSQSSYSYMANVLLGKPTDGSNGKPDKNEKQQNVINRNRLEQMFTNGDMQMAGYFLNQASDVYHIMDEIESVCAYMYQLDEAINVLRDNILNNEQMISDLPFDITFDGVSPEKSADYIKTCTETFISSGMKQKLNDHIAPKTIKFGRYFVMTIPYSEIGVKMFDKDFNQTRNMFSFGGNGYTDIGVGESMESTDDGFGICMESVDKILDNVYGDEQTASKLKLGNRDSLKQVIEYNLGRIQISDAETAPNITGITESVFAGMSDDMKKKVEEVIKSDNKIFGGYKPRKKSDNEYQDGTISEELENIPGSFNKLVDPRKLVPIKIFDHTIGYYLFENYDYSRMGTSITDILSNSMNFNDQNMVIDNMVGTILGRLKYGDLLKTNDDFKALLMNCVLYAERRNNPIRIKFVPCDYITEFKTNCDEDGNGQPVLLKSLIYARLYISLLLFEITTIITKSTDTEFYYLRENALSSTYEEQVADIIEQFRNSNIDISSILNGNMMHGNRAVNKRYFMSTGTQDIKPFDVDVVAGQQVDTHNDFLTDLKKMAIGSTGVPSVAVDYMD